MTTINESHSMPLVAHVGLRPPQSRSRHNEIRPAAPMTISGAPQPSPQPAQPAAADDDNPTTRAYDEMVGATVEFGKHLESIAAQANHLTPEGRAAAIAAFGETIEPRISAVEDSVRQRRDQAAAEVARIRDSVVQQGDTAQELRNTRAWDRHRRKFDAASDSAKLVAEYTQAFRDGDPNDRGVLLQDGVPYLEAQGVKDARQIADAALVAAVPELQTAQDQLRRADRECQVIEHDARVLRNGFQDGRVPDSRVMVDPATID